MFIHPPNSSSISTNTKAPRLMRMVFFKDFCSINSFSWAQKYHVQTQTFVISCKTLVSMMKSFHHLISRLILFPISGSVYTIFLSFSSNK